MDNKVSPSYHLNMVSPCNKNWEKMTVTEKGRFCKSCKKEVISLVGLDENGLNKILSQQPSNFCGRIEAKHLNSINLIPKRNLFNRVAASILIALGLTGLFTKTVNAQVIDASKINERDLQKLGIKDSNITENKCETTIEGTIRDKKSGSGVPFANIMCISYGKLIGGAQTDINGNFSFDISDSAFKLFDISIKYLGYDSLSIKNLRTSNKSILVSLDLQPDANAVYDTINIFQGKMLISDTTKQ